MVVAMMGWQQLMDCFRLFGWLLGDDGVNRGVLQYAVETNHWHIVAAS